MSIMNTLMKIYSLFVDDKEDSNDEDSSPNLKNGMKKAAESMDMHFNPHFTEKLAKKAVSEMRHKDGSQGEHWSMKETSDIMKNKNWKYREPDFYYAMNLMHSKQYKNGRSEDTYTEMAREFLNDGDVPEGKAKKYYLAMRR